MVEVLSRLNVSRYLKVVDDVVDVAFLNEFGIDEVTRLFLEQKGMMPKPLTWDKQTGEGLSWRKEDFEATFFKVVSVGTTKKPVLKPKSVLDWCQIN